MDIDTEHLGDVAVVYGLNVLYALILLAVGWWIARSVERLLMRGLSATGRIDVTVASFLASLAKYAVLVFVLVAVLQRFGIQTTSIIAVLGAASLAVGLALQGTLSNMAAGVMLLMFRPFRVGDDVEVAGKAGTVRALTLFTSELAGAGNVQILIPNGQVWGAAIINKSTYPAGNSAVSVALEVATSVDVDDVRAKALAFLKGDPRVIQSPEPSATLGKLGYDRIELTIAATTTPAHAAGVKQDLLELLRPLLYAPAEKPALVSP
ncbi:mechanosensitive ion channel domain-containing protein [Xanthobacter sp. DSM 24535]|uniref:mechanosensitive ion channel family protein n=1 Tax=Roseixanthobacter psychrophilus TaxID=3119917 RepID=UPI0037295D87